MNRSLSSYGILVLGIILCVLAGLSSCKDASNPVSSLDKIVFPAKDISYEKQVQPLFNIGCANVGCHERATDQNMQLDLTSFAAATANRQGLMIVSKDTANSILVGCIEGRPGSYPMPPARPLNQNQIDGLKQWILEGAKDTP